MGCQPYANTASSQTAVFPRLICGQLAVFKPCPTRVSGPGFMRAGIVSSPRFIEILSTFEFMGGIYER